MVDYTEERENSTTQESVRRISADMITNAIKFTYEGEIHFGSS